MFEERTQQGLLRTAFSQGFTNGPRQMPDVRRNKVGQVDVFGSVPDLLVRIKLGCISGKPFDANAFFKPLYQLSGRTAVNHPSIPHQDNPFGKMFQQRGNKRLRFRGSDIPVEQIEIKSQSSACRRNCNGRDNREPIPSVPTVMNWRLATRSPSTPHHRLQHKPAFVSKNDGFTAFSRVFLSVASRFFARPQWPLRCVRAPGVRVFGNSIPSGPAHARHRRYRSALRTVSVSPR